MWNEIRGSYMVCDENRVSRGKAKSVKKNVVAAVVTAGLFVSPGAQAVELDSVSGQEYTISKSQNWGGAFYVAGQQTDKENILISNNKVIIQENSSNYGGLLALNKTQSNIRDSQFLNNHITTSASVSDTGNVNTDKYGAALGGAIMIKNGNTVLTDVSFQNNTITSTATTGNGALVAGGAIYQDAVINKTDGVRPSALTIKIDKADQTYSGNDVSSVTGDNIYFGLYTTVSTSAGGFLFLDRNSSTIFDIAEGRVLRIGTENSTGNMDTIASSIGIDGKVNEAAIKKQGAGKLEINSSLDKFYGTVDVEEGNMTVTKDWTLKNTVNVKGGELVAGNVVFGQSPVSLTWNGKEYKEGDGKLVVTSGALNVTGGNAELGSMNLGEKGTANISGGTLAVEKITIAEGRNGKAVTLSGTGTLQTGSEQVMTTGLDEEGTTVDAGELNTVGNAINFDGGELALTDAKYNLDYAKSAQQLIGNTSLVMLGELVNQSGQLTVEELGDMDHGVLADVDVTASETDKQNLVVGSNQTPGDDTINGNDYSSAETHNNNLGAKTLTLGNDGNAVLVTGGKTLTLIGDGTNLIGTTDGRVNVDIGHGNQSGTLNLGTDVAANGGTLSGTVTVSETGTVNVSGAEYGVNGNLDVSGTVNVNNGATLNTDTVTLKDSGTVNVAGTMKADTLTAAEGTTINVGDSQTAGKLTAAELTLNGATLFLDPVWKDGDSIGDASQAAVVFSNGIDGKLVVGQNSLAVLGETDTDWAQNEFARSGKNWGVDGITAALAIRAPQTLAENGAIVVNGSLTAPLSQEVTSNSAAFADNSMLIVDAAGISDQAAITGNDNSTATVADNAALHVANAKNGQEIGILKNFSTITVDGNGWQGDNLTSNDAMIALNVTEDGSNGNFTVAATTHNAADIFPGAVPVSTMNAIWQNGQNDVDSANGGIAFLSRAADDRYVNRADAVRTINGAAQMAVAAGVQLSNLQALDSVTEALENHVSLTTNTQQANTPRLHDEGADLWAAMLYRHDSGDGMKSGGFNSDINNNFGGLIVGSDYTWKLAGDTRTRVGAALSIGKGDSHSDGDYNYSKNDYDTYGINVYGSWNNRDINVIADIGYMKGENEVEQHLSQNLGGKLKADVDTEMWTAGIKGEYRIQTGALDITPHLGIRYTHLKTDSFRSRNTLGTVFDTDSESYNIWQMPVGVTLSKDYKSQSGWTIKPKFDFSVIGAAGDTEAETRVRVPGVNAADSARADMMDSVSFRGIVGVEMQKDATSVGLSAGYQRSSTMNSTGFMLNIGHHF